MTNHTVFTESILRINKKEKVKLMFSFFKQLVKTHPKLFVKSSLLAMFVAIANFNVGYIVKNTGNSVEQIIKLAVKKNFEFKVVTFGRELKIPGLSFWNWLGLVLLLGVVWKSTSSLLHRYVLIYSYDKIEQDLKKDLFNHFISAPYPQGSKVSAALITQFANDLDTIADKLWFIPNRFIYVTTTISHYVYFGMIRGEESLGGWSLAINLGSFLILMASEVVLFRKATKLGAEAKRRYEKDNRTIYERINNLEYIKTVSGEDYEQKKIARQLKSTFQQNKKALFYRLLFQGIPGYVIIPHIPLAVSGLVTWIIGDSNVKLRDFFSHFWTVSRLNSEVNKIIDALLDSEELFNSLLVVRDSVAALRSQKVLTLLSSEETRPWQNGDITFQEVIFAYPRRPHQTILRNFSFCFQQGDSYGVAGKNGIGKSTITKTLLKLYGLQSGRILVGEQDIREINTVSLRQKICHQSNRPGFFQLTIAENVFYPKNYHPEDLEKLIEAAKKTGIWEFIKELPKQFQTVLKEKGGDLSEGQKQQIAAMRIFIRDYDVYFLDEILSNVHPNLRTVILRNIFDRIKGKTTIVIDHHYEIFQYVDYVYQFTGEKLVKMSKSFFLPKQKSKKNKTLQNK